MNKVSVIIPNYNHESFLSQRIESVLNQTFQPFQILILDDCSTDNSVAIIKNFVKLYPQINFVANDVNSGSTFAQWNKGVSLASGNIIWIAESDDTAEDTFLEKLVSKFDSNKDLVLAYCQSKRMNSNGEITGTWQNHTDEFDSKLFQTNFDLNGMDFIEKFLVHKNCIPNASAVVFKKETYTKTNGAVIHLRSHGDWLVWLQLLCYGNISFIAEPLNNFRYHNDSVIAKSHALITNNYKDLYGFEMRKAFNLFLKKTKVDLSKNACKYNEKYVALDTGHYGLYLLKNKKYFVAWKNIFKASFISKFQSYFIKKALGINI
jgi:glycosyltransferase involved in cell wall biosynthesis